jgi:uncharacterized SAM-binding protein YcdF (DUF218 family)
MTFIVSKILGILVLPGTALVLCCVIGLVLTGRRRTSRPGRLFLWLGILGFVAVLLLPLDQLALLPLEDRFPQVTDPPAHADGIVVLGGATDPMMTADRGIPSLNDAAERMTAAVALARRYPDARLVFTGGQGELLPGRVSEADVARDLFVSLGIAPSRLTLEGTSRNTWENAILTKALVNPQPGQTWILVTSAAHMPRSVGIFRRIGWQMLPWPVGYKSGHSLHLWLPSKLGERLNNLDEAEHEWIGLIAYRLMGRTDALFPAPGD